MIRNGNSPWFAAEKAADLFSDSTPPQTARVAEPVDDLIDAVMSDVKEQNRMRSRYSPELNVAPQPYNPPVERPDRMPVFYGILAIHLLALAFLLFVHPHGFKWVFGISIVFGATASLIGTFLQKNVIQAAICGAILGPIGLIVVMFLEKEEP